MEEDRKMTPKEIKECLLNILVQFDSFCKKNNLTYYLCGGTLLGAIRHQGFIPWDDDIDVMMPRPDYEKFLNKKQEFSLPSYLEKIDWKNGKSPYPFIKIIDKRTNINEKYISTECDEKSLWIDVFPIDGNPNDDKKNIKLYKKSKQLRSILKLRIANPNEGKTKLKKSLKKVICPILVRCINIKKLCERIDTHARQYDYVTSEQIGGVVWGYGIQERMRNKDQFMKKTEVTFEGIKFFAPQNWEEYLSNLYGDYMQLPPEEQRQQHDYEAYMVKDK